MKRGDVSQEVVIALVIMAITAAVLIGLILIFQGKFPGLTGGVLP
jgi:hypothetical protein